MEQPNMMSNPLQQPSVNGMQRAQPGQVFQQIHGKVIQDLRAGMDAFGGGWQATLDIRDRANRIMQLVTQLRFIGQDANKCLQIAQTFETRTIQESSNKETYYGRMQHKLNEIAEHRRQIAEGRTANGSLGMPGNPAMMANGMMNMPNNAMANMSGMGFPNSNMGMPGMQMNVNPTQNTLFPTQLQRPMQASPISSLQQNSMDPSAMHMNQQSHQMQQQQQQQQQQLNMSAAANQPQPQNMNQPGGQNQPGQLGQISPQEILANATKMFNNMSDELKNTTRARFLAGIGEAQRAAMANAKGDPLMKYLYRHARDHLMKQRAGQAPNAAQNKPEMSMGMNPGMQQQRPPSQAKGPNNDMSFQQAQADAKRLEDSGELVVPASNNNNNKGSNINGMMAFGNNMNAGQNLNPQMLVNQANQAGGNQVIMQQFLTNQRQQREREMFQKSMMNGQHTMPMAHQQSQNPPLRGQAGGGFNGGMGVSQTNSPAMPNLNRPLGPPGPQAPNTPQQNRQPGMPSTPMNPAGQLAQHHAVMVNQNSQQQPPQPQQQQQPHPLMQMNQLPQGGGNQPNNLMNLINRFPPEHRERLLRMPHHELQQTIMKMRNSQMQQQARQVNQPMMNPNIGAGGMQMGNQQAMSNVQQNMANPMSAFNGMPNPNSQMLQKDPANQLQEQKMAFLQQQQRALRIRAMDSCTFPKSILSNLAMNVPPNIERWGDLKRHISQNTDIRNPQGPYERVVNAQSSYFQANPQELQAALRSLQSQRPQGQMPNNPAQNMTNMLGAPPAQMVPPTAPMAPNQAFNNPMATLQLTNQQKAQLMQITDQDMRAFRDRVPAARQMNDEQIRHAIIQHKMTQLKRQLQASQVQQAAQAAQMQRTAPPNIPNANPAQRPTQTPVTQPPNAQAVPQKSQPTAKDNVPETSNQPAAPAASQVSAMSTGTMQQQRQGPPPTANQASDMDKLTAAQRAQLTAKKQAQQQQQEALRKAQPLSSDNQAAGQSQASSQQATAQQKIKKLHEMYSEILKQNPKGPQVQLDAKSLQLARSVLMRLWKPLQRIDATFASALVRLGEVKVKAIMRAKIIVSHNVNSETGEILDYLSINIDQLRQVEMAVKSYMADLQELQGSVGARAQQNQNAPAAAGKPAAPTTKSQPSTPMTRAPSQQGPVRKASASSKAPPAPTDNKSFDWEKPSGRGVPKYSSENVINLKQPPQKKRKPNQPDSAASTPVAQAGTPGAVSASPGIANGKIQSPDMARKSQQQIKMENEQREAETQKFRCKEPICEAAFRGFETEDQLKQHEQTEHQQITDPLEFFLNSASQFLGVKGDGEAPKIESAAAVPMKRLASGESKGPGLKREQRLAEAKDTVEAREDTLMDSMIKGLGVDQSGDVNSSNEVIDLTADPFADLLQAEWAPNDLSEDVDMSFIDLQQMFEAGYVPVDDDPHSYKYELRPEKAATSSPELTPPGSGSSRSSHAGSDVSQTDKLSMTMWIENQAWDAFGDGSGGVPERFVGLYLDEKAKEAKRDAAAKGDADAAKKGKDDKIDDDLMDWAIDPSFDSLFGAGHGLDPNYDWHNDVYPNA